MSAGEDGLGAADEQPASTGSITASGSANARNTRPGLDIGPNPTGPGLPCDGGSAEIPSPAASAAIHREGRRVVADREFRGRNGSPGGARAEHRVDQAR